MLSVRLTVLFGLMQVKLWEKRTYL